MKASPWEGFKIAPYRGNVKVPAFHARRQEGNGKLFDLRISDCAQTSNDSGEPQVNTSVSATKAEVINGLGIIHVIW